MCSHIQTKVMMKELEKSEIFEVNGGREQIVSGLVTDLPIKIVVERVIIPAVKDFLSKGAVDRGEAWEKYSPKC